MKMQYSLFIKRSGLILLYFAVISIDLMAQKPGGASRPSKVPDAAPGTYLNSTVNYIRSWEPSMRTTDPLAVTNSSNTNKEVKQTTKYVDGLGRPLQIVSKGTGGMGDNYNASTGYDIITPIVYDVYGREVYKYLPYVSSAQNGKFRTNPFAEQYNMLQNQYAEENENIFYSKINYEASPLERVSKAMPQGNGWAGSNKGVSKEYLRNEMADGVRIWAIGSTAGSFPASSGYYAAGELTKNVSANESGNKVIEYTDKEGHVILKKVQIADIPGADHTGWLCTYYVYDGLGNLRFVLPPKAVERFPGNGWSLADTSFRNELCFSYEYDHRRRMIYKRVPGAQPVEMVYDVRDRLVFMQDGNMRPIPGLPGKWLTTFYDEQNRPTMTAFYTTNLLRSQLESGLSGATTSQTITHNIPITSNLVVATHDGRLIYKARTSIEFLAGFDSGTGETETEINEEEILTTETIYANNPLPSLDANMLEPLTYNYYDKYTYPGKKDPYTDDFVKPQKGNNPYEEPVSVSQLTKGLLTGTKMRLLGTDEWLTNSTYYDKKGRVIQVLADNAIGGVDITTNLYDFNNKLLSSYQRHRNPRSEQTPETRVLAMILYDHAGRVLKITKQLNDDINLQRDIATNQYNALGQLKKKLLEKATRNPSDPLEILNYDYNVRGWLRAINKEYLSSAATHYFGQELSYDNGFLNQELSGNIAGIKWKGFNDPVARAYSFRYDPADRLLRADFTQAAGNNWDQSANVIYDFKMGDGITPAQAYDANGNIKRMQQWGLKSGGSVQIDDLTYTLEKSGTAYTNKLYKINDALNDPASTLGDFKDQHPDYSIDYDYDLNGNLTIDHNKNISAIHYNHLNLPIKIIITGKGRIEYIYDADGNKRKKIVTDQAVSPEKITTTDYVNGYVYENNQLQYVSHEEGRVRAIYKTGQPVAFVYDYFLKDHLGNIRTVLTDETLQHTYAATLETAKTAVENALFNNIDNTRKPKPSGYPSDPTTDPNDFVSKLDGVNQKTGPSLALRVMAGDKIQIGAKAFYQSTGTHTSGTPVNSMINALVSAFIGDALPGGSKGVSVDAASPFSNNFTPADYQRLREQDPSQNQSNKPRAYLNFVLFDDQFKLVDENSGARQVQGSPDQLQTLATSEMTMTKAGYLYVYTNNESLENVYFDNVVVLHTPGPVLEETHYYPFGLTMSGISSKAVGPLENRYKYNGIELNSDLELYSYEAQFRNLDPQIGRWWQVDPKIESMEMWSPYASNYNNPIRYNDPLGDVPGDYYNEKGEHIGNDGKDDKKVYVIRTAKTTTDLYGKENYAEKGKSLPITSEAAEKTENEIKAGNFQGDHMKNVVQIQSESNMEKMVNIVSKDDGTGGEKPANNREYGGTLNNNVVKEVSPGKVADPTKTGQVASITGADGFHSHPSGYKKFKINGAGYTASYVQPPSLQDMKTTKGVSYVFGMKGGLIYVHTKQGVIATIPINTFKK
ncbi:DUF6443 domain-containing protein [Chitinophaga niabensis]|uniref:DUF6443 domain-containing protein n=1 Tax=Chitinophaga niabensis TaxID=536979 RepID=UPI0031B9ADA1